MLRYLLLRFRDLLKEIIRFYKCWMISFYIEEKLHQSKVGGQNIYIEGQFNNFK